MTTPSMILWILTFFCCAWVCRMGIQNQRRGRPPFSDWYSWCLFTLVVSQLIIDFLEELAV